jgi:hypothetical protein
MNVFEDLVVELKEENLLESTVIETKEEPSQEDLPFTLPSAVRTGEFRTATDVEQEPSHEPPTDAFDEIASDLAGDVTDLPIESADTRASFGQKASVDLDETQDRPTEVNIARGNVRETRTEREFFKKRAESEMSSLKLVEAVLTSVEREYLKVVPNSYDDLDAKKALHFFLQVNESGTDEEHKEAEFNLLHQTELWCSALASRDANITVANLRRFCENCQPALSSQALLAIARFYRNLPYTESVRGKFDFVITRLFSRPMGNETRKLLFSREEMLGHVKTLYADWASVPLYEADIDETETVLTTLSFEELATEAESTPAFDGLIKSDFFGRLRLFKESIADIFFAPIVTAAAIEANVRIGNVYVKLIESERRKMDSASIHQRFGDIDDHVVSDAVARTLELVAILRELSKVPVENAQQITDAVEPEIIEVDEPAKPDAAESVAKVVKKDSFFSELKKNALSINRWFLLGAIVLISISAGLFVWANYYAEPQVSSAGVKTLSFQGTDFGEYVKTAKLSGETLYVVGQPTLEGMSRDKLSDLLQKLYLAGREKGWLNVNLMNSEGRTVGFASATRMDVYPSQ